MDQETGDTPSSQNGFKKPEGWGDPKKMLARAKAEEQKPRKQRDLSPQTLARSPHRADYESLMRSGWSARLLERYAAYRYGEKISHMAFHRYRTKKSITAETNYFNVVETGGAIDILSAREDLIRLQALRIGIDVNHEKSMGKLFSTTGREIGVLNELLKAHKDDLQDLGLFPKAGEKFEITDGRAKEQAEVPRYGSLADLVATDDEGAREMARVIHMSAQRAEEAG